MAVSTAPSADNLECPWQWEADESRPTYAFFLLADDAI